MLKIELPTYIDISSKKDKKEKNDTRADKKKDKDAKKTDET